jgi:hypothetical protein
MTPSRPAAVQALFILLALSLLTPGCNNCDSCCIRFASSTPPAPGSVACVQASESTCELLAVDLIISDVDDLFTVEFTFQFDPEVVNYEGVSVEGSLMSSDGTQITTLEDAEPGDVTVTISRLGAGFGGIDAEGERFLARLYFSKLTDEGSSALFFSDTLMFAIPEGQFFPVLIQGVVWSGGTLLIG